MGTAAYLLLVDILSVERTLLLTLVARERGPILALGVGAALALVADEGGDDIAVLAGRGLAVLLHHGLTFLADGDCAAFTAR